MKEVNNVLTKMLIKLLMNFLSVLWVQKVFFPVEIFSYGIVLDLSKLFSENRKN